MTRVFFLIFLEIIFPYSNSIDTIVVPKICKNDLNVEIISACLPLLFIAPLGTGFDVTG